MSKEVRLPWTEQEDIILRENLLDHYTTWDGWKELLPNRSQSAISHRATRIKAQCMNQHQPMIGRKVGMLTVISREKVVGTGKNKKYFYRCKCDCGNEAVINSSCLNLKTAKTISCGCARVRSNKARSTHGKSNSRLFRVWWGMKERCSNPNHKTYADYGGRGIRVCDEWLKDFETFYSWAMAHGYDPDAPFGKCTIDRIDVNGNYCPSNCRWVDMKTQCQNKRSA